MKTCLQTETVRADTFVGYTYEWRSKSLDNIGFAVTAHTPDELYKYGAEMQCVYLGKLYPGNLTPCSHTEQVYADYIWNLTTKSFRVIALSENLPANENYASWYIRSVL